MPFKYYLASSVLIGFVFIACQKYNSSPLSVDSNKNIDTNSYICELKSQLAIYKNQPIKTLLDSLTIKPNMVNFMGGDNVMYSLNTVELFYLNSKSNIIHITVKKPLKYTVFENPFLPDSISAIKEYIEDIKIIEGCN